MPSRWVTFSSAGGILGGWLPIMAPAVVTIALRLSEFDEADLDSTYALTLAIGWLSMIASLIGAGYLSDVIERSGRSRAVLARLSIPAIAIGGVIMASAPTAIWLAAAWVVVQVPSAMVITTALAEGGRHLRESPRSLVSGWAGAMPILALLIGAVGVQLLSDSLAWAFIAPAVLGAVLCLPLAVTTPPNPTVSVDAARHTASASPIAGLWLAFLAASFLLSWSTSTTNGFLVVLVQERIVASQADTAGVATNAVILASGLAIIASLSASALARGRGRSIRLWFVAAAVCAAALAVLVAAPSMFSLFAVAAAFGIAFGVANGVELAVVAAIRGRDEHWGRDMGILTAVTSLPYVLVPAVAAVVLAGSVDVGVLALFALAAFTALVAAITLAVRWRRYRSAREFIENSFNLD